MTQDATDRSETDRLREEVAEARHHLLTVQDHIVGLEAENGRLHRDLTRVDDGAAPAAQAHQEPRSSSATRRVRGCRTYAPGSSATAPASPSSSSRGVRGPPRGPAGARSAEVSPSRSAEPRFSIVTPVYDPPVDVLKECIESVIAQDFDDWELIMVDDFSPNAAVPTVIAQYAQQDPRIR